MQQQQQQGSASPASQLAVLLWTAGELRNSLSRNLFGTTSSPPPLSSTLLCVSLFCKPDASLFNSKHNNVETTHTHLFHQMTFLSPRPSPPNKELAPLGLIE